MRSFYVCGVSVILLFSVGCGLLERHEKAPFSISAVRMTPGGDCEPRGVPYYLPKPLLVVAKNFRHLDDSKIGMNGSPPIPGGYDHQSSYADIKANVTVPGQDGSAIQAAGVAPTAGATIGAGAFGNGDYHAASLNPEISTKESMQVDSFFTYQIVMVPDLSQKYGLNINGGPGEVRAAMNMVNGWMYTGMGPFYLKDSSTAQNRMAKGVSHMFTGRAAADVLSEVGELAQLKLPTNEQTSGGGTTESGGVKLPDLNGEQFSAVVNGLSNALERQTMVKDSMLNYAEIYIYEPELTPDGQMQWELIAEHHFNRDFHAPGGSAAATFQGLLSQFSPKHLADSKSEIKIINEATPGSGASSQPDEGDASGESLLNGGQESGDVLDERMHGAFPSSGQVTFRVPSGSDGARAKEASLTIARGAAVDAFTKGTVGASGVPQPTGDVNVSVGNQTTTSRRRLLDRVLRRD